MQEFNWGNQINTCKWRSHLDSSNCVPIGYICQETQETEIETHRTDFVFRFLPFFRFHRVSRVMQISSQRPRAPSW